MKLHQCGIGWLSLSDFYFVQTILFTVDEDILERVSRYDTAFETDLMVELGLDTGEEERDRPRTADKGLQDEAVDEVK